MGSWLSKSKEEATAPSPAKVKVAVDESELAVAKLKLQIDRLEHRLKKLAKDDAALDDKLKAMIQAKKKEEAYFFLKQKKLVRESVKGTNARLEFVHRQIATMEDALDDAKFAGLVKDSNRAIETLSKQIDLEELRIAKELQHEGRLRREELDQLLDDGDDRDLMAEVDLIERQLLDESVLNHRPLTPKEIGQAAAQIKEVQYTEDRGKLLAN